MTAVIINQSIIFIVQRLQTTPTPASTCYFDFLIAGRDCGDIASCEKRVTRLTQPFRLCFTARGRGRFYQALCHTLDLGLWSDGTNYGHDYDFDQ